jgi:hypothetical protein
VEVGFIVAHVGRENVSRRSIGADALWFGDHIAFPYDYITQYRTSGNAISAGRS